MGRVCLLPPPTSPELGFQEAGVMRKRGVDQEQKIEKRGFSRQQQVPLSFAEIVPNDSDWLIPWSHILGPLCFY